MVGNYKMPVAMVRVPRERVIHPFLGASLLHEIGHQVIVDTDIYQLVLKNLQEISPSPIWLIWLNEILADAWALSHLGVVGNRGTIHVMTRKPAQVFRLNESDPHPCGYLRVLIGIHLNGVLYPNSQWNQLANEWKGVYNLKKATSRQQRFILQREKEIPQVIHKILMTDLGNGRRLKSILAQPLLQVNKLREIYQKVKINGLECPCSHFFQKYAVMGQAMHDGKISLSENIEFLIKHIQNGKL
jgi:hypothetical protein